MKNSADKGGGSPQRPKVELDNTLRDLQNSSYPTKAEFNNCFTKYWKIYYSSPQPYGQPFWVQFLQASLCICWSEPTRFRYFCFGRWPFLEINHFIINSKYFLILKFAISLFVFPLTKYNTTLSPGFLGERFNNLQRAALLTSFWRHWFNNFRRATL